MLVTSDITQTRVVAERQAREKVLQGEVNVQKTTVDFLRKAAKRTEEELSEIKASAVQAGPQLEEMRQKLAVTEARLQDTVEKSATQTRTLQELTAALASREEEVKTANRTADDLRKGNESLIAQISTNISHLRNRDETIRQLRDEIDRRLGSGWRPVVEGISVLIPAKGPPPKPVPFGEEGILLLPMSFNAEGVEVRAAAALAGGVFPFNTPEKTLFHTRVALGRGTEFSSDRYEYRVILKGLAVNPEGNATAVFGIEQRSLDLRQQAKK